MILAKKIDGELWVKASDHHRIIKDSQRQWVGLTDEEKQEWVEAMPDEPKPRHIMNLINVIEVELKGRNV